MYDREELEAQALEVIEREELTFFSEIALFIAASEKTLYNKDLQELQSIKDALEKNRVKHKAKMRKKWRESDNPTLQISAYKLLADDEELKKLTINKVDASVKGDMSMTWNETKNYGANDKTNEGS